MTKKDALIIALSAITADSYTNPSYDEKETTRKTIPGDEVREIITKMIEQLSKPRTTSDEAKAKRKEKTTAARNELMEKVLPVLRNTLSTFADGATAKQVFETCRDNLPADFTDRKVGYIFLHEMADEVEKIETKKANIYKMK